MTLERAEVTARRPDGTGTAARGFDGDGSRVARIVPGRGRLVAVAAHPSRGYLAWPLGWPSEGRFSRGATTTKQENDP